MNESWFPVQDQSVMWGSWIRRKSAPFTATSFLTMAQIFARKHLLDLQVSFLKDPSQSQKYVF